MKVLITGASGLVGSALLETLPASYDIHTISRKEPPILRGTYHQMDLRENLDSILTLNPDAVIHTAAETNVDACENDPFHIRELHVHATERLHNVFPKAKFVYVSTDYVFDGKNGPYTETDETNPLGVYAKTKLDGEKVMTPNDLIVRTTVIFGQHPRPNFVTWLVGQLEQGKPVRIVNDQYGSPTYAKHLAQGIRHLLPKYKGIFNVVGPEVLNRYDFAKKVAHNLGLDDSLISAVSSHELKQRAPRPMRAGLLIDKLESTGFKMPSLDAALEDFLQYKINSAKPKA